MNNTSELEYEALRKIGTADRHFRLFIYLIALIVFGAIMFGSLAIKNSINHKLDSLVSSSIARSNQREAEQKTIAKETTRYITCIFVLPLADRTPDTQQKCFNQADLPGGLSRADFSPYVPTGTNDPNVIFVTPASGQSSLSPQSDSSSSPQPIPVSNQPQPDSSQPPAARPLTPTQPSVLSILQDATNVVQGIHLQ